MKKVLLVGLLAVAGVSVSAQNLIKNEKFATEVTNKVTNPNKATAGEWFIMNNEADGVTTIAWEQTGDAKYPNAMKSWSSNWDAICPIFKFSAEVRKVIYTTNAIESLNSTYRRLNSQRSVFPSPTALMKALYLATFEASKKWTSTLRNWGRVYGELSIMYDGRLPE